MVSAVGSAVTRFKPGDRVIARSTGALAERVAAPERRCFPWWTASTTSAAAIITVFNTAYVAVDLRAPRRSPANPAAGHRRGRRRRAGAVKLLKAIGTSVIALVSTEEKVRSPANAARTIVFSGATTLATDPVGGDGDHRKAWRRPCLRDGQRGETFRQHPAHALASATMVVIGFAGGGSQRQDELTCFNRDLSVMGAPLDIQFDHVYDRMVEGVRLVQDFSSRARWRPNIMTVLPFEQLADAVALTRPRGARQVVLRV